MIKDAIEFLDYFTNYYDLRFRVIYNDDNEIISKFSNRNVGICPSNITESMADVICRVAKRHIEEELGCSIDALKKNPSVQDYYNYLNFCFSRQATHSRTGETIINIKDFSGEAPKYVDQEVHEQALTMYLKKHTSLTDNEIQVRIFNKQNTFTGPYADICNELKMTCIGTKYGLSCIAFRPKMSYSNGFKYGDKFKPNVTLASLMSYKFDADFNRAWICTEDENLLLISMKQYNFLTTRDALAKDLGLSLEQFNRLLSQHITKSNIELYVMPYVMPFKKNAKK